MSRFFSLFRRRKAHSPACVMSLDDPTHVHGDACFITITPPSVVEVFNSQGCGSCPPALPGIYKTVLSNPNALLLTYNVTYWDHSGWKDTFARPEWDNKQKAYAAKWGSKGIYTPQVVVDGLADGVGSEDAVLEITGRAVLEREKLVEKVGSLTLSATGDSVRIVSDKAEAEVYDVLVVTFDPREQSVKIGAGPNKRKKLVHRNVVSEVVKVGEWAGGNSVVGLPPPPAEGHLQRAVIVQGGAGGPIVGVTRI